MTWRCRTITQSPFIPFIILFCHIIETSEASDLEYMRGLVETLESTSNSRAHSTCGKQRHLFKALYDVAAKYSEVKFRADGGQGDMSWSMACAFAGTTLNDPGLGKLDSGGIVGEPGTTNTTDGPGNMPSHGETNGDGMGHMDGLVRPAALQNTAFGDVDMEMDLSGDQLWDWFNTNQSIMRMLEDI
jgi:hypothetical protein